MKGVQCDPASVPDMSQAELLAEARRLARLSDLYLTPYTSAVLRRLCVEIEGKAEAERAHIAARLDAALQMRRGEAL